MTILIDPPLWPAHGTVWSHLISDTDYAELHEFARRLQIPRRGFDLDHYDVPAARYEQALSLGAQAVSSREVVHRLRDSGLRVRHALRAAERPVRRRQYLIAEWAALGASAGVATTQRAYDEWHRLGEQLLRRWNEPHRRYHDERHLEYVLLSLDQLRVAGEALSPSTLLAAWFHDAVYAGGPNDERDSAQLAVQTLSGLTLDRGLVQQVGEYVMATAPSAIVTRPSAPLAHLLDADLSIFASSELRYQQYSEAVREEYAHVAEADFRAGRSAILLKYLDEPKIFRSSAAQEMWEQRARTNLRREIALLGATLPR